MIRSLGKQCAFGDARPHMLPKFDFNHFSKFNIKTHQNKDNEQGENGADDCWDDGVDIYKYV